MIVISRKPGDPEFHEKGYINVAVYSPRYEKIVSTCYIALDCMFPTLFSVETLQRYRRKGFGHELMRGVDMALRMEGLDLAVLYTGRKGHARRMYEKHGWQEGFVNDWTGPMFCMTWSPKCTSYSISGHNDLTARSCKSFGEAITA